MDAEVRDRLLELGATTDEIERAEANDWLPVLVIERLLFPGPRYSGDDVDALVGTPQALTARLWRAMGFPNSRGSMEFTDADVAALKRGIERAEVVGDVGPVRLWVLRRGDRSL
jgi:hypothetical protein